jgi:glycosyltransferase involved in cell wall biosynthesis
MPSTQSTVVSDASPKVSVCVVTYNQVAYIRQCLQSIVDQETDFELEVIVADDCSQDGTQDIVSDFAARYPGRVKPILNQKNLGPWINYLRVHSIAQGEYIAHMDGDDFALPGKVQAQSDYLDQHPECNIAWHRMYVLNEATGTMSEDRVRLAELPQSGFSRRDLLRYMTIGANVAKMYRARVRDFEAPTFPMLDFLINVEQIGDGTAAFINDKLLGVYRAGIGISTQSRFTKILQKKSLLYFFDRYPNYRVEISTAVIGRIAVAVLSRSWRDFAMFCGVLTKVFRFGSVCDIVRHWKFLMMFRLP